MWHLIEINIPSITAVVVAALRVISVNKRANAKHARDVNKVIEWALSQPEIKAKSNG